MEFTVQTSVPLTELALRETLIVVAQTSQELKMPNQKTHLLPS